MNVVFLQAAQQDLKELRSYLLKNFGKDTWLTSFDKIRTAVAAIGDHPLKGNIPLELESLHIATYRQVLVGMNRIVYQVTADTVYIHIVCDARRELPGLLMRRLIRPD